MVIYDEYNKPDEVAQGQQANKCSQILNSGSWTVRSILS